jgi:hypothetical protein
VGACEPGHFLGLATTCSVRSSSRPHPSTHTHTHTIQAKANFYLVPGLGLLHQVVAEDYVERAGQRAGGDLIRILLLLLVCGCLCVEGGGMG